MTKQELSNKIASYKSYSPKVKSRVLELIPNYKLSQDQISEAMKKLPSVMKAHAKIQRLFDKYYKRAWRLERHSYAPEMNKLHTKDGTIYNTPQKTTIADACEYLARIELSRQST